MKRLTAILFAALCVAAAVSACSDGKGPARKVSIQELEAGFQNPPKESRVRVWWHWMGDDVTESGIRADFDWYSKTFPRDSLFFIFF